jgi:hypothetical protein
VPKLKAIGAGMAAGLAAGRFFLIRNRAGCLLFKLELEVSMKTLGRNRNTTGKWAIARVGQWHNEDYSAVGMGMAMAEARLVGRYQSKAEALAALDTIRREERNQPYRGDYEVRPFRLGDYIPEQQFDYVDCDMSNVWWDK